MKKEVVFNFIVYSLPSIIGKLVPFVTLPITTLYLSLNDFGKIALFELSLIPFQVLLGYGPGYVINSTWYKLEKRERGLLLFTLIVVSTIFVVLGITILGSFRNLIFPLLIGNEWESLEKLFPFLLLAAVSTIPNSIFDSWLIIEKKATLSTIVRLFQIVLTSITIVVIAKYTKNYQYVIMGTVSVGFIIAFTQFILLSKTLYYTLERRWFKLIYRVSGPIFLRSIFAILRTQFDRILVSKLFGPNQYALYNFSGKVNSSIAEISVKYQNAYDPFIYQGLAEGNMNMKRFRSVLYLGAYMVIFVGSILILFGQNLIDMMTNKIFSDSYNLIVMYSCTIVVTTPFMGNGQVIIFHQKTKYLFYITAIQTFIIVAFAFLLVPKYGALGGIISFWIGTLFYMLMYYFKKRQLCKEQFIEKSMPIYVVFYHLAVVLIFYDRQILAYTILLVIIAVMTIQIFYVNRSMVKNMITKVAKSLINSIRI
jgi:O-antigen/teichoic acid export membrane protein